MITINLIAIAFAAMSVGQFVSVTIATEPEKARVWQRALAALCCTIGCVAAAFGAIASWSGWQWIGMVAP